MKIDHLITQYLYQQKRVSLPGIGTFTLENGTTAFTNKADAEMSPELIEFIRTHTGKMTPLATADLESYIMLNKQFLNIGKALHFEGIGTLVKAKEGLFEFTPGEMITERLEERGSESRKATAYEEKPRYSGNESGSGSGRKLTVFLGIAVSLGIIIWGGWKWSQSGTQNNQTATTAIVSPALPTEPVKTDSGAIIVDSISRRPLLDTSKATVPSTAVGGSYKFVIETTNRKARALKRYAQLVELRSGIKMETADSVVYKLYFVLPASAADTTRLKDSLRLFYASRIVTVEKAGN